MTAKPEGMPEFSSVEANASVTTLDEFGLSTSSLISTGRGADMAEDDGRDVVYRRGERYRAGLELIFGSSS